MPSRRISSSTNLSPIQQNAVNAFSGFNSSNVNMLTRIVSGGYHNDVAVFGLDVVGVPLQPSMTVSSDLLKIITASELEHSENAVFDYVDDQNNQYIDFSIPIGSVKTIVDSKLVKTITEDFINYESDPKVSRDFKIEFTLVSGKPKAILVQLGNDYTSFAYPSADYDNETWTPRTFSGIIKHGFSDGHSFSIHVILDANDTDTKFCERALDDVSGEQENISYVRLSDIHCYLMDNKSEYIDSLNCNEYTEDIPYKLIHPMTHIAVTPGVAIKDDVMLNLLGTDPLRKYPIVNLDVTKTESWIHGEDHKYTVNDFTPNSHQRLIRKNTLNVDYSVDAIYDNDGKLSGQYTLIDDFQNHQNDVLMDNTRWEFERINTTDRLNVNIQLQSVSSLYQNRLVSLEYFNHQTETWCTTTSYSFIKSSEILFSVPKIDLPSNYDYSNSNNYRVRIFNGPLKVSVRSNNVKWAYVVIYYTYFKNQTPNRSYIGLVTEDDLNDVKKREDYLVLARVRFVDINTIDMIDYSVRQKLDTIDATKISFGEYIYDPAEWDFQDINDVNEALNYLAYKIRLTNSILSRFDLKLDQDSPSVSTYRILDIINGNYEYATLVDNEIDIYSVNNNELKITYAMSSHFSVGGIFVKNNDGDFVNGDWVISENLRTLRNDTLDIEYFAQESKGPLKFRDNETLEIVVEFDWVIISSRRFAKLPEDLESYMAGDIAVYAPDGHLGSAVNDSYNTTQGHVNINSTDITRDFKKFPEVFTPDNVAIFDSETRGIKDSGISLSTFNRSYLHTPMIDLDIVNDVTTAILNISAKKDYLIYISQIRDALVDVLSFDDSKYDQNVALGDGKVHFCIEIRINIFGCDYVPPPGHTVDSYVVNNLIYKSSISIINDYVNASNQGSVYLKYSVYNGSEFVSDLNIKWTDYQRQNIPCLYDNQQSNGYKYGCLVHLHDGYRCRLSFTYLHNRNSEYDNTEIDSSAVLGSVEYYSEDTSSIAIVGPVVEIGSWVAIGDHGVYRWENETFFDSTTISYPKVDNISGPELYGTPLGYEGDPTRTSMIEEAGTGFTYPCDLFYNPTCRIWLVGMNNCKGLYYAQDTNGEFFKKTTNTNLRDATVTRVSGVDNINIAYAGRKPAAMSPSDGRGMYSALASEGSPDTWSPGFQTGTHPYNANISIFNRSVTSTPEYMFCFSSIQLPTGCSAYQHFGFWVTFTPASVGSWKQSIFRADKTFMHAVNMDYCVDTKDLYVATNSSPGSNNPPAVNRNMIFNSTQNPSNYMTYDKWNNSYSEVGLTANRGFFTNQYNAVPDSKIFRLTNNSITRSIIKRCNDRILANTSTGLMISKNSNPASNSDWGYFSLSDLSRWWFDGLEQKFLNSSGSPIFGTLTPGSIIQVPGPIVGYAQIPNGSHQETVHHEGYFTTLPDTTTTQNISISGIRVLKYGSGSQWLLSNSDGLYVSNDNRSTWTLVGSGGWANANFIDFFNNKWLVGGPGGSWVLNTSMQVLGNIGESSNAYCRRTPTAVSGFAAWYIGTGNGNVYGYYDDNTVSQIGPTLTSRSIDGVSMARYNSGDPTRISITAGGILYHNDGISSTWVSDNVALNNISSNTVYDNSELKIGWRNNVLTWFKGTTTGSATTHPNLLCCEYHAIGRYFYPSTSGGIWLSKAVDSMCPLHVPLQEGGSGTDFAPDGSSVRCYSLTFGSGRYVVVTDAGVFSCSNLLTAAHPSWTRETYNSTITTVIPGAQVWNPPIDEVITVIDWMDDINNPIRFPLTVNEYGPSTWTRGSIPTHQIRNIFYVGNPAKASDSCHLCVLTNYGLFVGWNKSTNIPVNQIDPSNPDHCFKWVNLQYDKASTLSMVSGSSVDGYSAVDNRLQYPTTIGDFGAYDIMCVANKLCLCTGNGIWWMDIYNENPTTHVITVNDITQSKLRNVFPDNSYDPDLTHAMWRQQPATVGHTITKLETSRQVPVYRNKQV